MEKEIISGPYVPFNVLKTPLQSLLMIAAKFRFYYYINLSELINFYPSWNCQKIYGF